MVRSRDRGTGVLLVCRDSTTREQCPPARKRVEKHEQSITEAIPGYKAAVAEYEQLAGLRVGELFDNRNFQAEGAEAFLESRQIQLLQNIPAEFASIALYPRSVCWMSTAFQGLRCHPLTSILLNIRFAADSNPTLWRVIDRLGRVTSTMCMANDRNQGICP